MVKNLKKGRTMTSSPRHQIRSSMWKSSGVPGCRRYGFHGRFRNPVDFKTPGDFFSWMTELLFLKDFIGVCFFVLFPKIISLGVLYTFSTIDMFHGTYVATLKHDAAACQQPTTPPCSEACATFLPTYPCGDASCKETFVSCLSENTQEVFWGGLNGLLIEDKVVDKKTCFVFEFALMDR